MGGLSFDYVTCIGDIQSGVPFGTGTVTGFFGWAILVLTIFVHVCFGLGVSAAVRRLRESGRKPWFVGGEIWVVATFLGGALVAGIYWLIHHSSLGGTEEAEEVDSAEGPKPGQETIN